MAKLTTFSRFLIVLLIVGALFFGLKTFAPQLFKKQTSITNTTNNGESTNTTTSTEPTTTNTKTSTNNNTGGSTQAQATRTFNYTPTPPSNGKLKGVVELGASGFNSFIIRIDNQKNWKLEKAEYGSSLVYEKLASDADITSGLKNYIAGMLNFGVSPRDIHFVISSGAQKVEITKKIISELKKLGYVVNAVTAEQEGKLALKCVLPTSYENNSFVVDIGSGNTKISYLQGGQIKTIEASGAKYSQNNLTDEQVYSEVLAKSKTIPSSNRKTCFIIGGIPFELAKQTRNGKERYTVLNPATSYTAQGDKQRCGINIYKAIADATSCEEFVFDWEANFTIGFLLSL